MSVKTSIFESRVEKVEAYQGGDRIASHLLAPEGVAGEYRTRDSDLPEGPRYREWDRERIEEWAARIGTHTSRVIDRIFESVPVEEQGINPALAVLRLTRRYSAAKVETACEITLRSRVRSPTYLHLRPNFESRQDETKPQKRSPRFEPTPPIAPAVYVRGAAYFGRDAK